MKIITRKDKIVLAELRPDCSYIMLINPYTVKMETIRNLHASQPIQIVLTNDVNDSIRFVEVPKKTLQAKED